MQIRSKFTLKNKKINLKIRLCPLDVSIVINDLARVYAGALLLIKVLRVTCVYVS